MGAQIKAWSRRVLTLSAFAKEKLVLTKVDACMPISFLRAIHAHCINFRVSRTFFRRKNMSFTSNWTQEHKKAVKFTTRAGRQSPRCANLCFLSTTNYNCGSTKEFLIQLKIKTSSWRRHVMNSAACASLANSNKVFFSMPLEKRILQVHFESRRIEIPAFFASIFLVNGII